MASLKEHQEVLLELLTEFDRVCRKHDIKYILFAGSALGAVRHKGFIPWDDDLDVAILREDYDRLMSIQSSEWGSAYYLQCEYSDHWPVHFSKLRKNNTTCLEKYHPKDNQIHQGIYIDIFPIDNASDKPFIRKLQFIASKVILAKSFFNRGYETKSVIKKIAMTLSFICPLKLFHNIVTMRGSAKSAVVHSFLGGTVNYKKGIFERRWLTDTIELPFETLLVPVSLNCHELLTMQYGDYMTLPPEEERKCKVHAILVDTEKSYTEYEHYRDGMTFEVLTRSIR
jgi:lipopolysaccharide cholinephosphotransferase